MSEVVRGAASIGPRRPGGMCAAAHCGALGDPVHAECAAVHGSGARSNVVPGLPRPTEPSVARSNGPMAVPSGVQAGAAGRKLTTSVVWELAAASARKACGRHAGVSRWPAGRPASRCGANRAPGRIRGLVPVQSPGQPWLWVPANSRVCNVPTDNAGAASLRGRCCRRLARLAQHALHGRKWRPRYDSNVRPSP